MNAAKAISNSYAKWFDERVRAIVNQERLIWQPEENYLQWNALFVTLTFDKRRICRRKSALNDSSGNNSDKRLLGATRSVQPELSPEFWNVDWLYKRMCRAILGRHFHRHRDQQPLMIACADVNGTRYGTPDSVENLHIHSLWVFRNGQINAFKTAIEAVKNDPRLDLNDIDEIQVEPITSMRLDGDQPSHLNSYGAKFLGQNAASLMVGQDLAIYPSAKQVSITP